jgi:hypothetical protein
MSMTRAAFTLVAAALLACGAAFAEDAGGAPSQGSPDSAYRVRVAVSYPGAEPGTPEVRPLAEDTPIVSESVIVSSTPTEVIEDFTPVLSEPWKVLASLGGEPITEEDGLRELWRQRGRETFDWLVGRAILRRELANLGLDVRDREVSERLELHLAGLRQAFPGLTLPDELTRAASGLPLEEYKERTVWSELALRKIMQAKSRPGEEKLRQFHAEIQAEFIRPERVKISQVFIPPQPGPDSDGIATQEDWRRAERQILEADSRLRMKENFADIARAYGTGGQLSRWVERGELLRDLEAAAFSILPGAITTPIRTSMGYHILTVEEKEERQEPDFEEVRNEVLTRYREAEFLVTAGQFMADLKAEALGDGSLDLSGAGEVFAESGD